MDKATLFGDHSKDWQCPLCLYKPQTALIACPECGCHILLAVKLRRLHDILDHKGQHEAAQALYGPQTKPKI